MKKSVSDFFIDRPIFSTVLSLVVLLLGGIGFFGLPITQYPDIVPPTIAIETAYPGASPEVLMQTVATPIEQELNGVEGMIYMTSKCNSDGTVAIEVTFELGTDINAAQVLVQNRVEIAKPVLPQTVKDIGVRVKKRSPALLLGIAVYSPDNSRDSLYITNFFSTQVRDRIMRIDGVGDVVSFGSREYSMRVWLDPDKLNEAGVSAMEVASAIGGQNRQVVAGKLNQPPVPEDMAKYPYELQISAKGRLDTEREFGNIIVRRAPDGRIIKLRDVARIELGAYSYGDASFYKGKDALGFLVYQTPGSNAWNTAGDVLKLLEEMKKTFPSGVDYVVGMDNTTYIADSIKAVYRTIFEAILLVVFVMMVFLQKWKAAIIPVFAIPVSLVGTFFFMKVFGFSINNLTLFGLVLAIGIVVDDAIVVVENVERNMQENPSLGAKEATKRAMAQVQGALIAIVLVLTSVFVPTAFVPGIAGEFYRQFALTIAASTFISGVVSLTLTPALTALFLEKKEKADFFTRAWNFLFGRFFGAFNAAFAACTGFYGGVVRRVVGVWPLMMALYALLLVGTVFVFNSTPKGFIPSQDTCYFYISAQLPDGASVERTAAVLKRAEVVLTRAAPEALRSMGMAGFNIATLGKASNSGTIFVQLKRKEERIAQGVGLNDTLERVSAALNSEIPEAVFYMVKPPVVSGIGFGGDFKCFVQDRHGRGLAHVDKSVKKLLSLARTSPAADSALSTFSIANPEIRLNIDREAAERLNVDVASVFGALRLNLAPAYINDFNMLNRTYKVVVQSEGGFRRSPRDIMNLRVPSHNGCFVQVGSFAQAERTVGAQTITRYNLYPAAELMGNVRQGYSTGEVIADIEKFAAENLGDGAEIEWTDLAFQEKRAQKSSMGIFALCVVFVFLMLAAMYESWRLPLSVILIVPTVLLFSVLGVSAMGDDINVMTQIGFIVLIGLACKNAILIVEFAKQRQERGEAAALAAENASRNRLRPILMTSFAFILGVLPLVYASGTGSELRNALGTPVFFGMLGVTVCGLVFTPVFFYAIRRNYRAPKSERN